MLIENLQLMDLLFSFLEPNRPHSTLLAGYFSKVCIDNTLNLVYLHDWLLVKPFA